MTRSRLSGRPDVSASTWGGAAFLPIAAVFIFATVPCLVVKVLASLGIDLERGSGKP